MNYCSNETKSDKVRRLVAAGEYRKALLIAKDFRLGISKEDHEKLSLGYEVIVHPRFYEQLGYDLPKLADIAKETIIKLYGVW